MTKQQTLKLSYNQMHQLIMTTKTTTTTIPVYRPFVQDFLGEPVLER